MSPTQKKNDERESRIFMHNCKQVHARSAKAKKATSGRRKHSGHYNSEMMANFNVTKLSHNKPPMTKCCRTQATSHALKSRLNEATMDEPQPSVTPRLNRGRFVVFGACQRNIYLFLPWLRLESITT